MKDETNKGHPVEVDPNANKIVEELSLRRRLESLERVIGTQFNERSAQSVYDLMRGQVRKSMKTKGNITGVAYARLALVESYECLINNCSYGTAENLRKLAEEDYNSNADKLHLPRIIPERDPEVQLEIAEPVLFSLIDSVHFPNQPNVLEDDEPDESEDTEDVQSLQ